MPVSWITMPRRCCWCWRRRRRAKKWWYRGASWWRLAAPSAFPTWCDRRAACCMKSAPPTVRMPKTIVRRWTITPRCWWRCTPVTTVLKALRSRWRRPSWRKLAASWVYRWWRISAAVRWWISAATACRKSRCRRRWSPRALAWWASPAISCWAARRPGLSSAKKRW